MSESCRCPYAGLDMRELSLLDPKDLIKILNKAIPVLFKNGGQEGKILQMAALLEDFSGNSGDVDDAIRAIVSWELRGGELYLWKYDSKIIESISKITSCLEEGKVFWRQELIKSMEGQTSLNNISTWIKYSKNIDKIAEVFQIKGNIENLLQKAIDSDKELNKFEFWKNHYTEVSGFVKIFGYAKRNIQEKINSLIIKNTKKIDEISEFANEDSIKKAVDNIVSDDSKLIYHCLSIARHMELPINPDKYQTTADNLLILANKLKDQNTRKNIIRIAHNTYTGLKSYNYQFRESIIKAFDKAGNDNFDRIVLREASKVLGFEYQRQNWKDF